MHAEIGELEKSIDQFCRKASKLDENLSIVAIFSPIFIVGFVIVKAILDFGGLSSGFSSIILALIFGGLFGLFIAFFSFYFFIFLFDEIQLSWKYSEKFLTLTDVNIDYIKAASHVLQTFEKHLEKFPGAILTHRDLNGNKLEVKIDLKSREVYGELLIDAEFCSPEDLTRGMLVKATYTGNTKLSSYKDAASSYKKLCTEFRACVEEIAHKAQREEIGKLKEWIESEINKVRAFLRELGSPVRIFIRQNSRLPFLLY